MHMNNTTINKRTQFWDRIAERYARKPVADEALYQRKLAISQEFFRPDMDVFEFGCGTGSTAIVHAPHVRSYVGVDLSAKMIEIAQSKPEAQQLTNLTFAQTTLEEYPEETSRFDVVLGLSILHLLDDPDEALRKVHRLLKPGGLFISSTAAINDVMPVFRFIAPIGYHLGLIPKLQFFSGIDIEPRINKVGFKTRYALPPNEKKGTCFVISEKLSHPEPTP